MANTILKQTPVNFPKDFNNNTGSLLMSVTGDVLSTIYHCSLEEKEEIVKRINEYPKLVKLVCQLVDNDSLENDDAKQIRKDLVNFVHNYSRKTINNYK